MTVLVQKEAPNELTYLDANRIEGVVDLLAKREPVSHKHDRWVAGGASSSAGGLASDTQNLEPRAEPTYQQTVVRAEPTHQQSRLNSRQSSEQSRLNSGQSSEQSRLNNRQSSEQSRLNSRQSSE